MKIIKIVVNSYFKNNNIPLDVENLTIGFKLLIKK